jgi:hypothetical protein
MQSSAVDDVLIALIWVGILMSVANLLISLLNGRTSQMAHLKATSNLRDLYERTYRKTPFASRRFVSIARPGKTDRRRVSSGTDQTKSAE